jgi:hypothetical protein
MDNRYNEQIDITKIPSQVELPPAHAPSVLSKQDTLPKNNAGGFQLENDTPEIS